MNPVDGEVGYMVYQLDMEDGIEFLKDMYNGGGVTDLLEVFFF